MTEKEKKQQFVNEQTLIVWTRFKETFLFFYKNCFAAVFSWKSCFVMCETRELLFYIEWNETEVQQNIFKYWETPETEKEITKKFQEEQWELIHWENNLIENSEPAISQKQFYNLLWRSTSISSIMTFSEVNTLLTVTQLSLYRKARPSKRKS